MAQTKRIAFFHQNYPAQFGPVMGFLQQHYGAEVTFISQHQSRPTAPGVHHVLYQPDPLHTPDHPYFYSRYFEAETRAMSAVHNAFEALPRKDFDVLVGHVGFGNLMFLHAAYPHLPTVGFFEIFYDPRNPESSMRPEYPVPLPNQIRVPLRNATQLLELEYCHKGYSPTPYQKSTFPRAYQDKLHVLFDGIDTQLYSPGPVDFETTELPISWPKDAKIITFVSRGLESFRGFDLFMEAAWRVSQQRPDVHFVIAGNPKTHYGPEMMSIKAATFKDHVLAQHPFDLSRFHFLNWISEPALRDLYRLTRCHVYWTIPFTLSWSFFQALATGAPVLASNSAPVQDVLVDGENGFLVEPYDLDALTQKMLDILEAQDLSPIQNAARQTIVDHYSLEVCLPKLAEFYFSEAQ